METDLSRQLLINFCLNLIINRVREELVDLVKTQCQINRGGYQ